MPVYYPSSSSGSSGAMVKIAAVDLGADTATIDFTSIPGTYRDLHIVFQGRTTESAVDAFFYVQFNGDTGSNYWDQYVYYVNTAITINEDEAATKGRVGLVTGATGRTNGAGVAIMDIPFYAGTTFEKTLRLNIAEMYSTGNLVVGMFAVRWGSTAAITSITFLLATGNFLAGSQATLYGLT